MMHKNEKPGWGSKILRGLLSGIDSIVFWLLSIVYGIFFNVSSIEIFSGETIINFFSRIQLIIGVYMIFKVSISIINGIVNPDGVTSGKDANGISKIVTRMCVCLAMLILILPISIPSPSNSWEKQINNNGLLFGTLYDLQDRILKNNTIGKLILGVPSGTDADSNISDYGDVFAADILKSFITPNLSEEAAKEDFPDGTNPDNLACPDSDSQLATYVNTSNPDRVLSLVLDNCTNYYTFNYTIILSTIVGVILIFIMVFYTIDVAIRVLKLAILRLLAPIPIISYIDPKSQKDGAFGNWVKTLTSTYLDLFLMLAIIYFIIFLVQQLLRNEDLVVFNGEIGIMSKIFLIVGLFFFAKQAPKFIKDMLGVKGGSGHVGINGLLGGTAALVGGGGLAGAAAGALSSMDATSEAAAQGRQAPSAWSTGRDLAAQIRTGDPKAKGGIMHGLMDRATRSAGITQARKRYGVTAAGLSQAKNNMFAKQAEAAAAEDLYNRFNNDKVSEAEMNAWAKRHNAVYDAARGTITDSSGVVKTARKALYDDMGNKQSTAAKAKSHYEDAKKFADSHRITPNFAEEHQRSLRERLPGHGRADLERQGGGRRYSAHQSTLRGDTILGSPNSWDGSNSISSREDNRWDPGKFDGDLNSVHGDSRTDTGTPGS